MEISTTDSSKTNAVLKITNIHYGTLIAGSSVQIIQTIKNNTSNIDQFGIIAHTLEFNQSKDFQLEVNTDKKSIVITKALKLTSELQSINCSTLKFKWHFYE